MLSGSRCLDRRVQCEQIGLTGNRLNHQGHALNIVTAQAQGFDQLTAGIGALTELMHARDRIHQFRAPRRAAVMRLTRCFKRGTAEL